MNNAYMIRNDGQRFPCEYHVYGYKDLEDVDETLNAAGWLYQHTKSEKTKKLALTFIHSFAVAELNDGEAYADASSLYETMDNYIHEQAPYFNHLNHDILKSIKESLFNAPVVTDLKGYNNAVCEELNQEFLRARYGGMYNTESGSKEMVFRISSTDFDWFNIIYMFVADFSNRIQTVTVCADEESTGRSNFFYEYKGKKFNQMPIDDFLSMSGTPIMENLQSVKTVPIITNGILFSHGLSQGYSIMESLNTQKNINRIVTNFQRMRMFHLPYSFIRDK